MTAKGLSCRGPERPRSPTSAEGLYATLDWALVRAPLLAADAADGAEVGTLGDSLLPNDQRVRAAISVASADMAATLARTRLDKRKANRARGKLLRYLIRMSTRPTPYGLFAGVGLIEWGAETDLALGPESPRTRTRPDMEWLLDLVARLERDPGVRPGLRLVANSGVAIRGGRLFLVSGSAPAVSVRATGAVRRALELARLPILYTTLAEEVSRVPGATPEKAERLIDELWRQGFLLSDLRPPLTGADPAYHVRDRLAGIPEGRAVADDLAELAGLLAAWDGLPFEERVGGWSGLLARIRTLDRAASSPNLLQTDMALPLAGTRVHGAVGAEAVRAAELLLRVSPYPRGLPELDAYRHAFEDRYGPEREIPLLELLDPDFGLGPPVSKVNKGGASVGPGATRRNRLLLDLALDAYRNRRPVIELDDGLLKELETWTPERNTAPHSLDIPVFVAARSAAAIDAGNFQVIVGPNVGAVGAGRNLGRFADLLGARAQQALAQVAHAEAALAQGCMLAEVVYMPEPARSANVAIRPTVRSREITIATVAGVADEHVVAVNELVVGVRNGRFAVRWPAGDVEVVGVQGHMLNSMQAPAAARFLLDVADDRRCHLSRFNWGAAGAFPFLPRVQCGRVILALAQWRIDPAAGDFRASFADALGAWRQRSSVPRYVYLAVGDNRLLLDLDAPEHVELLREELHGLPDGHSALLQEALPGLDEAWLPDAEGGHISELVVPMMLLEPPVTSAEPAHVPARRVSARVRLRLPGSDWLNLKLSSPRPFEDQLIAGPLCSFGEFATGAGLSDGWFFLRYADPDRHLRVRFHGEPAALLGPLMQQICGWASELVADGVCEHFGFDTYEREVERYGGEDGMRAAETVFTADSRAVAGILRLSQEGGLSHDMTTVAVVSIDNLLQDVGLDTEERAQLYRDAAWLSRADGAEYRRRKNELRELLSRREAIAETSGGQALAGLLAARRATLADTATVLRSLERKGRLAHSRSEICRSYIHLHANRLLGTDPQRELLALQLLRRTREGLARSASG